MIFSTQQVASPMSRLCQPSSRHSRSHIFLDLFGTLIYPTLPVHIRYNQLARDNGFGHFQLSEANFKTGM
ncbi:hypothetical protein PCASD_07900 [Puccinia coronata f. sp. avenae]|uniref:Uncharacterized protein n=1 Tax=Puccinia coronata f. sp. avenae TaxID=200324 RepID=A0A2N5UQE6_9BASI|nr:hypothetical protein PCASD_21969 [Puccinia coronata f. sp. avenae]PLW39867.1 hypothetical protein PCASD_07900 [Puccinia coronata f. sp. avenae]